jgi:hypothetical protein
MHSAAVLKWLEEPEGRLFSSWLLELHSRETRKLKDAEETTDVFRAQGSVGILDVLMRIKEDLRRYERDVIEGRCQPIKEVPDGMVGRNQEEKGKAARSF